MDRPILQFLKGLIRYWWALMSCAAFTFLGVWVAYANKGREWVLWGSFALSILFLLVASYRTWLQEHRVRFRLQERLAMLPKLWLTDVEHGTMWGQFQGVLTNQGPENSIIRMVFQNVTTGMTEDAIARQVRATILFHDSSGKLIFKMDGRWSNTTQPPNRDPNTDVMGILAVDFPIGATRPLDIAFKPKARDGCYGFNNDSYQHADLQNPAFRLPAGTIIVDVFLSGVGVRLKSHLQFHNPDGPGDLRTLKHLCSAEN